MSTSESDTRERREVQGADGARKDTVYYSQISFSPSLERPERLVFVVDPRAPEPPESLAKLRDDYKAAARVVSRLFRTSPEDRRDFFTQLHEGADIVFLRPGLRIADGRANLDEVKVRIQDRAEDVRSSLFRTYTGLLVLFGVIPCLFGAAIYLTSGFGYLRPPERSPGGDLIYAPMFSWALAAFWVPAGAVICVWADFAVGMLSRMSFDKLLELAPNRWQPVRRVVITVGFALIFAYVLDLGIIQVGVANRLLNDFDGKSPTLALLVGGITGLAFTTVVDLIFSLKPATRD